MFGTYSDGTFPLQTVSHLKLLMAVATAVLVGLLYGDSGINAKKSVSNIGLLLIGVAYLWYTTLMPSVLKCTPPEPIHETIDIHICFFTVPSEIAILKKETFNNWYKIRTYFLANMLTTTPMHVRGRHPKSISQNSIQHAIDCSFRIRIFADTILDRIRDDCILSNRSVL